MMGLEPMTSSLPRKCSTAELHRLCVYNQNSLSIHFFSGLTETWSTPYERKTGLEPATYSLEGYRSTNWATSADVGGEGFEPSKPKQRIYSPSHLTALESPQILEPPAGIEPATYWLQVSCSTSWAKEAYFL